MIEEVEQIKMAKNKAPQNIEKCKTR